MMKMMEGKNEIEKSETSLSQIKRHDACSLLQKREDKQEEETGAVERKSQRQQLNCKIIIIIMASSVSLERKEAQKLTSRVPS